MPLPEFDANAISTFIETAKRGKFGTASHGEVVAHKLAKCLSEIGDDMVYLDEISLQGFYLLAEQAKGPWDTDNYKETVFRAVRMAAAE